MSPLKLHIDDLVSQHERHLKTRALDAVEYLLLLLSGLLLFGFTTTVFLDVVTRLLQSPILWLQEATIGMFIWGVFIGASAALRRREHFVVTALTPKAGRTRRYVTETVNCAVIVVIGVMTAWFGFQNFQQGFGNHLPVTRLPLSVMTGAIPVFGVLAAVFSVERLTQGWRHGFEPVPGDAVTELERAQEVWE